jgi:IS5 family transposase
MTMASIVEQMTAVYVFVDDYLKAHPGQTQWRFSNHHAPAFNDAEVITIGLLQSCLNTGTLRNAYEFVADNLRDAFPLLPSYAQWIARLHCLTGVIGQLLQAAGRRAPLDDARFYLLDSMPVRMCKPVRHGRVRLLCQEGAYWGKNSTGWFFGFKLHVLVHHSGVILATILTPANWPDQEAALAMAWSVRGGLALADLGYRSEELAETLMEEADLVLLTPASVAKDAPQRALISSIRERVETTFSALWERMVDRVRSRSWEGLWCTLKLKMLHYNLGLAGLLPA